MQVDEARRDDEPSGVDPFRALRGLRTGDEATGDDDVPDVVDAGGGVDGLAPP
jgi:hypothetical protein